MMLKVLAVALVGALTLSACGGDDGDEVATEGDAAEAVSADETADDADSDDEETEGTASEKPTVEVPDGEAPEELEIVDLTEGDGPEAAAGDLVTAHYVGVLHDDGTEFDSSWDRGQTFSFRLGAGEVIPGWDQGIEGMKVGGRRMLVIPSDLAYGEFGSGDVIGPDADLVFVVDLVDVLTLPDPADEPSVEVPEELTGELEIEDLVEGDGEELRSGHLATIHYVLALESSGEVEDSSWSATPVTVPIGVGTVIPGWDEGLVGMKVGGRRLIVVPPELGFGAEGNGPIPPDDTMVFVVDLLKVN